LRYFVRFTITRSGFASNITREKEIWVVNYGTIPEKNPCIKMEIGIEDCLHLQLRYEKSNYYFKDAIIGKIFFELVRINIKYVEIVFIKRESTGIAPNIFHEKDTITKYEVMEGTPVRGESIPFRLFLAGFDLIPTYKHINNKFSLKYYLNLVIIDDEDRRYFKQTEIVLWRKKPSDTSPPNNMIRLKDDRRNKKRRKKKTNNKKTSKNSTDPSKTSEKQTTQ